MKIIDVRDGFIKFEADESIELSSIVKIEGDSKDYVAQVIQKKENIAYAKILFILSENVLIDYDKTLPSLDSEIINYTEYILKNFIQTDLPIITGRMSDNINNIIIDLSAFNKKTIVSIDEKKQNNIIIRNLTKQFGNIGKKTIIIDTLGIINSEKFVAGKDFKLPLDTNSLKFMYEECLEDATQDSKSTIIEIFKSLAEYSQTVPFVPFKTLKTIVDDMVEKSHVFKLLVLKNKLAKFDKLNYFATEKNDVDKIETILNQDVTIIDLSKLDTLFMNRFLGFVYEHLKDKENVQVILELSNSISKKALKQTLVSDVPALFVTHSNFSYLNELKNFFENYIVAPSIHNNQIFRIYSTFLKAMDKDTFLITGNATNYIPFVSKIQTIDDLVDLEEKNQNIEESKESEDIETLLGNDNEPVDNSEKATEHVVEEFDIPQVSQDEITTAINEKANAAIEEVTENLETPETLDMFSEDDDISEEISQQETSQEEQISNIIEISKDEGNSNDESILEEISGNSEKTILDYENNANDNINIAEDLSLAEENNNTIEVESETAETQTLFVDNQIDEKTDDISDTEIQIEDFEQENSESEISNDYEEISIQSNDLQDNLTETVTKEENIEVIQDYSEIADSSLNEDIQIKETIDISDIDLELDNSDSEEQEDTSLNQISDEIEENDEQIDDAEFSNDEIQIINEQNNDELDFGEIIELDPTQSNSEDIVVDLEEDFAETVNENAEEQIAKDVDKVFTTRKEENNDFSESDLDFIDELNNDEDAILEEVSDDEVILKELEGDNDAGIINEPQEEFVTDQNDGSTEILERKDPDTPIVPVYDADIPQEDLVESDPIEQGDSVVHAKYGNGVVEKMIKYGSKTLYSINFENIGRRLLDPTLTEIKKA